MESVPPSAGSQVSRVPAQRTPPEELAPPTIAPVPQRPRRPLRTVLSVVAGVLVALCLGGGVVGYLVYDRATTPDRSSPTVVVDSYLRAFLVEHNDVRAAIFTCTADANFDQLLKLRSDLQAREARFDTTMLVSWEELQVTDNGNISQVSVDLVFAAQVDGIRQTDRQSWSFDLRLSDDWRVCSAEQRS
ncbi:hypothetical protein [Micromonospora sp. DT229]|uniref:hypothetical protein n=1 Tax=Micromonospora sp. DT229 TaxID=3393430 RepID=UPI003CE7639F